MSNAKATDRTTTSAQPAIASRETWLDARKRLLVREKAFSRERDALAAARRALPWVESEDYAFEHSTGAVRLSDLFGSKSQLAVYHFMFGPEAKAGCPICSFWADNFERSRPHLAARDVALAVVSRAQPALLDAFKARMGWTFPWVSSGKSTFNADFSVSFTPEAVAAKSASYNYGSQTWVGPDMPGLSVFAKGDGGKLYHTYSTYGRGLEDINATYRLLDIVPKGRDEAGRAGMAWVKHHDRY
jgi:predicted dithiol-disulfide oxidoreductase (DUF899 family)